MHAWEHAERVRRERACEEEAAGGGEVVPRLRGHTLEAAKRQTRQPACAKRWRGAGAAQKARERRGLSTGHDSFAGVACVGDAGDGVGESPV